MITLDSPIVGTNDTFAWPPVATNPDRLSDYYDYVHELYRLCQLVGFDFRILYAQAHHETDGFTSQWWRERRNPAGIGITGDPAQNAASHTWANGTDAARAHVVHMWAYANDAALMSQNQTYAALQYQHLDPRFDAVIDAGFLSSVTTLGDLGNGKWATDPQYAQKIAATANRLFTEEPMATKPTVLLIAGHRSHNDAGNPVEKNMTDDLARAYKSALSAAGYAVTWLQETDGDSDPDDTAGGLDTVSNKARQWCANTPGQKVLLDLHFEGTAPSVRGCFAIIPDVTGLTTGAPVPQNNADTWERNAGDRALGRALVEALKLETGLPLRTGIREPGLMDESQTGVGGQGYRLATFAYTSPHCADTVRLVVEHGAHTNAQDRAIIMAPGFFTKVGKAAVRAMETIYGQDTAPTPQYAEPVGWPSKQGDVGIITVGAAKARLITCEVECTKPNGTVPRAYASSKAGQSGPKIKLGQKVTVIAKVTVPGEKRPAYWYVLSTLDRVGATGFTPSLPSA